jgi:dTDP-4-amino-4,6-dideoxygalactose transaminase
VHASLSDCAIQARYYNRHNTRHPYFVANPEVVEFANLPVTEDIRSRIVPLPVHDDMAPDNVASVVAAVQDGSSQ